MRLPVNHTKSYSFSLLFVFLEVDNDGRSYFPRRQESKSYRFREVQRLLFYPPQGVINWASGSSSGGKLWQWQQMPMLSVLLAAGCLTSITGGAIALNSAS